MERLTIQRAVERAARFGEVLTLLRGLVTALPLDCSLQEYRVALRWLEARCRLCAAELPTTGARTLLCGDCQRATKRPRQVA